MHDAVESREPHVLLEVARAERGEAADLGALLAVRAHDAHAGEVLLRERGERAELLLHRLEPAVDGRAELDRRDRQQHHRQQREQRESHVDAQHEHQRECAAEDRVRQVHDRRADGHADGAQVVGEPGHQVAGPHAAEVGTIEPREVYEERLPEVVLDVAAEAVQQLTHPVAERATDEGDGDDGGRDRPDLP